jgi:hypothetical protein
MRVESPTVSNKTFYVSLNYISTQYFGHINKDMIHFVVSKRLLATNTTTTTTPTHLPTNASNNDITKAPPKLPKRPIFKRNPYKFVSIVPDSLNEIDLNEMYITSALSTSASVVPVYNPGFRVGTLVKTQNHPATAKKMAASENNDNDNNNKDHDDIIQISHQSTYIADLESLNRQQYIKYRNSNNQKDKKKKGKEIPMEFFETCDTRDVFGVSRLDAEEWNGWLKRIQDDEERVVKGKLGLESKVQSRRGFKVEKDAEEYEDGVDDIEGEEEDDGLDAYSRLKRRKKMSKLMREYLHCIEISAYIEDEWDVNFEDGYEDGELFDDDGGLLDSNSNMGLFSAFLIGMAGAVVGWWLVNKVWHMSVGINKEGTKDERRHLLASSQSSQSSS